MAAGLAAELKNRMDSAIIEIKPGQQKSEFAVYIDDKLAFSRLEQRRYPDAEEIEKIILEKLRYNV
ncbi:MAG: Rdx family protein [Deferribacterales bacterium]